MIGSTFGYFLLSNHVYILNACAVAFLFLALAVTALIPGSLGMEQGKSVPLKNRRSDRDPDTSYHDSDSSQAALMEEGSDEDLISDNESIPNVDSSSMKAPLASMILEAWRSSFRPLKALLHAPKPTSIVLFCFLMNGLAANVTVMLSQYISLTLHWSLAAVNSALGTMALVSAIWLACLPTLRQKFLEPRMSTPQVDLFITQASLIAKIVGYVAIGFALPAPLLVLALCIYTIGIGAYESLVAYGSVTLPKGQTASDFYVGIGLLQLLSGMVGSATWAGLFNLILKNDAVPMGLLFWIGAGVFGVAAQGIALLKKFGAGSTDSTG